MPGASGFRTLSGLKLRIAFECDSSSSVVAAIEAGRGITLTIPVLKLVTGKRFVYRPQPAVNETVSIGIARRKNGDVTPAGERFCDVLPKVSKTHRTSI